jgi:hypothetical protein
MKSLVIVLMLFTSLMSAQASFNFGYDAKIGVLGTDNQFTTHSGVANYEFKVEYIDGRNTYFAIGHKYVNLVEEYNSFYINFGQPYKLNEDWTMIIAGELGMISRKFSDGNAGGVFYPQFNTSFRYSLFKHVCVGAKGYVQLSRDIGKAFRYGGNFELNIK